MTRHNLSISDELWAACERAAAQEGAERGKPGSVSAWIREAIRRRLGDKTRNATSGEASPNLAVHGP